MFTALLFIIVKGAATPSREPNTEERIDERAEVTVRVRPEAARGSFRDWRFTITLDTHSVELDMDLAALSELRFQGGAVARPVRYEGDPPGGHHRTGVLVFPAAAAFPERFELKLRGIGNSEERIFVWP